MPPISKRHARWTAFALTTAFCAGWSGGIWATTAATAPDVAAAGHTEGAVTDAATKPLSERLGEIGQAHRLAMIASLKASAEPRDWAFAALIEQTFSKQSTSAERETLLGRAAAGAPNDVLVQWIAELQRAPAATQVAVEDAPLQALQRLEPDNAAVWLQSLISAMQREDRVATDTALAQMAASKHMDEHLFELQAELAKTYERYPLPDEYFAIAATQNGGAVRLLQSREATPYVMANMITLATALPAYQFPMKACRVNPATGENLQHKDACATAGRLMAADGKSMIANRIGFSMLRVSGTNTDEDVQNARLQDWIWRRWQSLNLAISTADNEGQVQQIVALFHDQSETHSELEAARRALARAGEPATPPANWIDDYSPFSDERIHSDQAAISHPN